MCLSRPLASALCLSFALSLAGCRRPEVASLHAKAEVQAQLAQQRQAMEQIPPPSKNRYMTVHTFESWDNPWITVQPDMLTVHILYADSNPTAFGAGGMLRPTGARREEVNISLSKLGEAMTSIPANSWPYGRVVAVEEAHQTPGKQEPMLRRNMESMVSALSDLGIVAYDLAEGNAR